MKPILRFIASIGCMIGMVIAYGADDFKALCLMGFLYLGFEIRDMKGE